MFLIKKNHDLAVKSKLQSHISSSQQDFQAAFIPSEPDKGVMNGDIVAWEWSLGCA